MNPIIKPWHSEVGNWSDWTDISTMKQGAQIRAGGYKLLHNVGWSHPNQDCDTRQYVWFC
jgi:hypothetical protein